MIPEPGTITTGDSMSWNVSLPDYPAGDWVLHYAMFNAGGNYAFDAGADGVTHVVSLAIADTAAWTPGRYDWTAYVTRGTERKVITTGTFIIKPDPTAGTNYDARSHARKMLDAIEAALENRATTQQLDMIRGTFGDRAIELAPEKLIVARDKYKAEVATEDRQAKMQRGERVPRNIKIKFTR